ncbi:MAG: protein kinase [Chitinispirillaceae bacterium]|nr:protein kinase [Chitinispirillaceae bacterium]
MAFSLNDYSNFERIGSGGMGDVYSAMQRSLGRKVAIKKMAIVHQNDSTLVKTFENEARIAASLDHANIIRIHDFGEDNGSFYIAMEYIDGYTLAQLLTWNPFPKETALIIMHLALKGLCFAHSRNIAHCDLKPNNILVSKTGRVVVTDFGIANASAHAHTRTPSKKMLITPAYIPPEQAIHIHEQVMSSDATIDTIPVIVSEDSTGLISDLDLRKDIWSVGVLLYRILSGKHPFNGQTAMATVLSIERSALAPITTFLPTLPDELSAHIDASLIKEPRQRLSSLEPLQRELQELIFDMGVRDGEQEIRQFFADTAAYASGIEKNVIGYHVRKGNEFKAAGNSAKSQVHFEAAKRIVFDPSKKDQPITLFPWQTQPKLAVQEESNRTRDAFFSNAFSFLPKVLSPKRIITAFIGLLVLMLLLTGITFTVSVIQRVAASTKAPQPTPSMQSEQRSSPDVITPAPTQSASPASAPHAMVQKPAKRKTPDQNRAPVQKTRKARKMFSGTTSAIQRQPYTTKRKESSPSGTLVVTVDPASSYVFIDEIGVPRQELYSGKPLATGPHVVSAIADGHQSFRQAVIIETDSTVKLAITLKPMSAGNGFLHVYCFPWADLYIDGSYRGQAPTPNLVSLSEGTHSLRLQRKGFQPYIQNIQITAGEESRIQIEMEKE